MIRPRVKISRLAKTLITNCHRQSSLLPIISFKQPQFLLYLPRNVLSFSYSSTKGGQNKIIFQIQKAKSPQQLRQILIHKSKVLNFIHRNAILRKVTQWPFDYDEELQEMAIAQLKENWKNDLVEPTEANSRAIANAICYMSRKKKLHHLDSQFIQIDYYKLARYLSPIEFVMTLNGLLKLQLTDKIQMATNNQFNIQTFIKETINEKYTPSHLVSMWFNLLKYHKSSLNINNFFSQLLKNKHFKNNLIDYMQIVFCYVNSEGFRTIDLTFPIMNHPTNLKVESIIGAHELSVLYEHLAKLKKIKDVYFSEEFNQLLESSFLRIINENDPPLRNLANVMNYMVQYENPTSKTLEATFHKYYTVIKSQIGTLDKIQQKKKFRTNVDPLSFVSLLNYLLEYYQSSNTYLNQLVSISIDYIKKIIHNQSLVNQYNQRTFVRLLSAIDLAKKMLEEKNSGTSLQFTNQLKSGFEKQITKRSFSEPHHFLKLANFVHVHEIRSKEVCQKVKRLLQSVPKESQFFSSIQQRITQKCLLSKNCKNCINCFSK